MSMFVVFFRWLRYGNTAKWERVPLQREFFKPGRWDHF